MSDDSPYVPLRTTTSGTSLPDKDAEIARLRAELEKWRVAATVLCGEHIGVPQPMCPVCETRDDRERLRVAVDPIRDWYDGNGEIDPPLSDVDMAASAVQDLFAERDETVALHANVANLRAKLAPILSVVREVALCWSGKTEDVPHIIAALAREASILRERAMVAERDLAAARAALAVEREACDEWRRRAEVPDEDADLYWYGEDMDAMCAKHDARRAAEAKENP